MVILRPSVPRPILFLPILLAIAGCQALPVADAATPTPAPAPAATTATAPAAERPLYYEREITASDLEGRTLRELTLMRNWIYARAGNVFRKQWLHDFFSAQPWYEAGGLDEKKLSALDRKNAEAIAHYENALPRGELERRLAAWKADHLFGSSWSHATDLAVFSPDGRRIAATGDRLDVFEVPSGRHVGRFENGSTYDDEGYPEVLAEALGWSPDGKRIASVLSSGEIRVQEIPGGKVVRTIAMGAPGNSPSIVFGTNPWHVWVQDGARTRAWNLESGAALDTKTPPPPTPAPVGLEVRAGPNRMRPSVVAYDGAGKRLWEWSDPRQLPAMPNTVRLSPDGSRVLVIADGVFTLLDAKTGTRDPAWRGHDRFPEESRIEAMLLSRALGVTSPVTEEGDRTPLDEPKLLDERVTVDQLKDFSRRDLRILRNMIYARRGRPFKSPVLREYFERMEWYRPDPAFTEARLSKLDRENLKLVQSVEASVGGPMSDEEQRMFEAA